LRSIAVHCGNDAEALRTTGTLPNHCGSLQHIVVQVAHAAVECITHTETPKFHLPPLSSDVGAQRTKLRSRCFQLPCADILRLRPHTSST